MNPYRLLEHPAVYHAAQLLLAPGMNGIVTRHLAKIREVISDPGHVLDVGCGPSSRLWKIGMRPIGLDYAHAYTSRFRESGGISVTASAAALPFRRESFDAVLCFGLLHHLPDDVARMTVREAQRVTRPGGHVIVFDPVLPTHPWRRPIAWCLCKLDRGRFIRSQPTVESRILGSRTWDVERITHSYLGTEGVFCVFEKGR
jgi:ubiquinone/menaquinone biosynthesis C-methylase UbiE